MCLNGKGFFYIFSKQAENVADILTRMLPVFIFTRSILVEMVAGFSACLLAGMEEPLLIHETAS